MYKSVWVLVVLLLIVSAVFLAGCDKEASGELGLKSVEAETVTVSYSFDNCQIAGLFIDGELRFNTECGIGKGTYKIVGLEPDTNYLFQLIDIGDPGQPVLDTLTIKTLME